MHYSFITLIEKQKNKVTNLRAQIDEIESQNSRVV